MSVYYRLQDLPGLGPKRLLVLGEVGIKTVPELLRYLPRQWIDQSKLSRAVDLHADEDAVLIGTVTRAGMVPGRKPRFVACLADGTGELDLVWFAGTGMWAKRIVPGVRLVAIGRTSEFRRMQLVHPEVQILEEGEGFQGGIVPVYPLTEEMRESRVDQRFLRKTMAAAFALQGIALKDPVPESLRVPLGFLPEMENLKRLHMPAGWSDIRAGRRQLKLGELLPPCLRMTERRRRIESRGRASIAGLSGVDRARATLPFQLTAGQEGTLAEILGGLAKPKQYHGMLQGDVGSGKTAVAYLAMAAVLDAGHQCAYMVPTDILARQQFAFLKDRLAKLGKSCGLLVGALRSEERRAVVVDLATGKLDCVVGTHALFSNDVGYADLGFVIVDEQHRFGVNQREALLAKGDAPDLLVMSATPIPRSLAMTLYGDLEPVILREKPPGRKPIRTRLVDPGRRADLKKYMVDEVSKGNRCYWIVPKVGEDESGDVAPAADSVVAVAAELVAWHPDWTVASVHGRMEESERDAALAAFAVGKAGVLVATTVVEVGVNVPEANLLVIESPERFGLSQLHQLRGRVGRGSEQAWCFLLCDASNPAYERLEAFTTTEDGFEIAEQDLRFRGAGNLEGGEQSGQWIFRYFDFWEDRDLVQEVLRLAGAVLDGAFPLSTEDKARLARWMQRPETTDDGVH